MMPRKLRSTGCRVCVQRRVRCDETRPFCKRCIKSGLQCSGFPPPIQWIDETQETADTAQRKILAQQETLAGNPGERNIHKAALNRELKDTPDTLFFTFLMNQFVGSGIVYTADGNHTWLAAILKQEDQHPTSMLAARSLAQVYFGRKQGQQEIVDSGSRMYGKALIALSEDLKTPGKAFSYDTLAATVALTLFEHFMFTTSQGWVQHSRGIARLMELRGPESFLTYPDRAILEMNRNLLTLQALVSRKRTFLEQKNWIEAVWPEPTPRPLMVRLQDIFVRLPGMAEDILKMVDNLEVDKNIKHSTQCRADLIVNDLQILELELLVAESDTSGERDTTPASPTKPFETDLKYQSLLLADTWVLLDALMILALQWQYKSRHLDWQIGVNHEGFDSIPDAREYALHICRSVEYLLQPKWLPSAPFYLLFPVRVAFFALPVASPQALWLVGILERIALSSGFEMARNVLTNVQINEKSLPFSRSHRSISTRAL